MSKTSEVVRKGYEAWNRDDREAWLEKVHPNAELHTSGIWTRRAPPTSRSMTPPMRPSTARAPRARVSAIQPGNLDPTPARTLKILP
jgi:ketosteroid isomerase-like protein